MTYSFYLHVLHRTFFSSCLSHMCLMEQIQQLILLALHACKHDPKLVLSLKSIFMYRILYIATVWFAMWMLPKCGWSTALYIVWTPPVWTHTDHQNVELHACLCVSLILFMAIVFLNIWYHIYINFFHEGLNSGTFRVCWSVSFIYCISIVM